MHAPSATPMMLSTNVTMFTLPTAATFVTASTAPTHATARIIGHSAALRFQTAPGGGLYGAVWLRSAGLFHVYAVVKYV
jgi:hypothetical protein